VNKQTARIIAKLQTTPIIIAAISPPVYDFKTPLIHDCRAA
jgi:hypothetical protein